MQYWWVNQNQTYQHEVFGGYMWSPKTKANGDRNQFYENMILVEPGDVVFSFCDTYIKAVGVVTGKASTAPRPSEFGTSGANWVNEGWYVPVEFRELINPTKPKDHMTILAPLLPGKYAPLQRDGNGLQGVYLAALSEQFATAIIDLLHGQVERMIVSLGGSAKEDFLDEIAEKNLLSNKGISETEKEQLVKARRGQGLFRSQVELVEPCCRVTGVSLREHLRASHIKPWRDSDNKEKLDGNNGLLLAPHVDHLFDRGYISFQDDGCILVSPLLDSSILLAWNINKNLTVGLFNSIQKNYLAYHRDQVFKAR
jgi:hypothetical protein